jgi:hypothetical protein
MPVYKFKTFEESEKALWCFYQDKEYYKRVSELFDLAEKLCPINCPQGIFKFRTIEEAQEHRKAWIQSNQ